jgi:protein tyrosine phosphatase
MFVLPIGDNANEIVRGLWLGNAKASQDTKWLAQNKIKTVFNCTKDLPFHRSIRKCFRVPVDDNLQEEEIRNLEFWSFEIVSKLSKEYRTEEPILVHCAAGMQRSAAVVAMFLIAKENMSAEDAIKFIREKRPIAFMPMANFGSAIKGFERSLGQILQ